MLSQFEIDYGAQLIGSTIARVRGSIVAISLEADGAAGSTVSQYSGWGLQIVPSPTLAAPAGQLPDPTATGNRAYGDWFGLGITTLLNRNETTAQTAGSRWYRWEMDVKAMRRLDELGDVLMLSLGTSSTVGCVFHANLSCLVLLP